MRQFFATSADGTNEQRAFKWALVLEFLWQKLAIMPA